MMVKQQFMSRFFEWQNYVHYILNGLFLAGEVYYWELYGLATFRMILIVIALIFVNDTIIHALFWYGPRKIRWRD